MSRNVSLKETIIWDSTELYPFFFYKWAMIWSIYFCVSKLSKVNRGSLLYEAHYIIYRTEKKYFNIIYT